MIIITVTAKDGSYRFSYPPESNETIAKAMWDHLQANAQRDGFIVSRAIIITGA